MSMKNQKNVVNDCKNLDVNYLTKKERKKARKKDRKRTIL
jgi:hypothetical protein